MASENKKGMSEKRKEHFSSFWRGNPAVEGKNHTLERERVQLLSRFPGVRTVGLIGRKRDV